ncbi:MAG: hypothetical protein JWQ18_3400, partial [Conexibacter sp.]|nr:hypothetical protein [Conexibacter sp.]
ATGPAGPAGTPATRIYASVAQSGALSRSHGIGNAIAGGPGQYSVQVSGAPDLSDCIALVQAQSDGETATAVANADGTVDVRVFDPNLLATSDGPFVISVVC